MIALTKKSFMHATFNKLINSVFIKKSYLQNALLRVLFYFLVSSFCLNTLYAQEYSPYGLYDIKSYKLPNNLEVYLRNRSEVRSVSIRLVVNVGHDNFECGKTETAHFLEHLLFTGTSKHSENELDALIEENGGSWNAETSAERTVYEIDIYNQYTGLALETLHEIITDSTISPDNVELSRGIIYRESSGPPTEYAQFLYQYGIGKSGYDKASEIIFTDDEYCAELESAVDVTREDILDAYQRYYVPNNMALIVVGDFSKDEVLEQLNNNFGQMKPHDVDFSKPNNKHAYLEEETLTGTLSPVLSNDADIYVRFRIPGYLSNEFIGFAFISHYLSREFYKKLRVDNGYTYSADSGLAMYENYGELELYADAEIGQETWITYEMMKIVDTLIEKPIDTEDFNNIKRGLLLDFSHSLQSNNELADYYAEIWHTFLWSDRFDRIEDLYKALTPEDIHRIASKYLMMDNAVMVNETPTLTYNQLYILLSALILGGVLLVRHFVKR